MVILEVEYPPPIDKETKSSNNVNLVKEKKNINNKKVKIQNKIFNSLKIEKTPEKKSVELSKFDKFAINIKTKKAENNLKPSKDFTPTNPFPMYNSANPPVKKKLSSPKLDNILVSKKTIESKYETEKSTGVFLTLETNETSIHNSNCTNFIYSHYNKGIFKNKSHYKSCSINNSQNQSKLNNSLSIDYSMKMIDLMEKMKNFLIISTQNQSLFLKSDPRSNSNQETPNFALKYMKKNHSEDFDLLTNNLYLELNKNYDILHTNKINRLYKDIDSIYKGSCDLNESAKNNFMYSSVEAVFSENIKFESTRANIDSINLIANKMESLYIKLFQICKDCLSEINTIIFESFDNDNENSRSNSNNMFSKVSNEDINKYNSEDRYNKKLDINIETIIQNNVLKNKKSSSQIINQALNLKKNVYDDRYKSAEKAKIDLKFGLEEEKISEERNNSDKKNKLIQEKLETLKNLKQKKEQIMNSQRTVKFDETGSKNTTKTLKNANMTEIDPSEINENVLEIYIPQSNICEVNKPVTNNNNYRLYTSEEQDSFKFNPDSQVILHLDNDSDLMNSPKNLLKNDNLVNEEIIEKSLNETILDTGNSFMKNHRRSRSSIIEKQVYTYSIKPK